MEKVNPELSRRQLLAALTVTSLGGLAKASGSNDSSREVRAGVGRVSRVVTFDAKVSRDGQQAATARIGIDVATTAVIVCDMQNDFGAKGGMFDRAGVDISMIQQAVGPTAGVLAAARHAGIPIVYLKMGFRSDLSDLGSAGSVNRVRHLEGFKVGQVVRAPDGRDSRTLIRDNWGTDIVAELAPHTGDVVLYKHRFSGFFETDLDSILKRMKIRHLIVTGCTTSVCVESTIRDAMFRDYLPVLLSDCSAEPIGHRYSRSNHEASLLSIETLLGWVSVSTEFVKALEGA